MGPTNSGAPSPITGVVLCGGAGRRMGGVDKPLLPWHGRPLVAHVIDRMRPQVATTVLIANRSLDQYAAFGLPVHQDLVPGLGPLGGLSTALAVAESPLLFCCPGDAPLLAPDLVYRLAAMLTPALDAVYPDDGDREQPLFLLLRTRMRPALAHYLAGGHRAVHGFLASLNTTVLDAADIGDSFRNINSPGDLEKLERGVG